MHTRIMPQVHQLSLLLIIGISLNLYSCKNKKEVVKEETVSSTEKVEANTEDKMVEPKSSQLYQLIGSWTLTEVMGEAVETGEGMETPSITLTAEKQINGSGGCNSVFGGYSLKGKNFIQFSELAMTERACSFRNYDDKLLEALTSTQQFILTPEKELHLIVGKRAPLAKFQMSK